MDSEDNYKINEKIRDLHLQKCRPSNMHATKFVFSMLFQIFMMSICSFHN